MTNEKVIAVLRHMAIEHDGVMELTHTPEQIAALDHAIALYTAIESAGGEGKEHVARLYRLSKAYGHIPEEYLLDYKQRDSVIAGAAAITALAASEAKVAKLTEALRDLVDRLDDVHRDEKYISVWQVAQLHLGPYTGTQYCKEHDAARAALKGGRP